VAKDLGIDNLTNNQLKDLSNSRPEHFVLHAELALIKHLESVEIAQGMPNTHRYISVSKLCCRPCWSWIQGSNLARSARDRWKVLGCHRKYYRSWRYPKVDENTDVNTDVAFDELAKGVKEDLKYIATHDTTRKPRSDSTMAMNA